MKEDAMHKLWVIVAVAVLSGCATQGVSSFKYLERSPTRVANEITISKPQPRVWDGLVKELSKSFFVINNIDKESRIINLSFSSNSATDYVECGQTHRVYQQGSKKEVYDYDVAGPATFKFAASRQAHASFAYYAIVQRETSVEGRSNIYLAPDEKDSSTTIMTVNTRYILTIKTRGQAYAEHVNGNVFPQENLPERTHTVMFNTNQPGQGGSGGEMITCFSKGKLEKDILDLVKTESRGANK
jgi:hypothetical protein